MGYKAYMAYLRAAQAEERRNQREEKKRLHELELRSKQQEKLSALEKARLEVETWQNSLDLLLSVHKEQGETWDWAAMAASLPPPQPQKNSYHEFRAKQQLLDLSVGRKSGSDSTVEQGRLQDQGALKEAQETYS